MKFNPEWFNTIFNLVLIGFSLYIISYDNITMSIKLIIGFLIGIAITSFSLEKKLDRILKNQERNNT